MCGPNGTPVSGGAQIGPVSAPAQRPIPVESLSHPAPSSMSAAFTAPLGNVGNKAPVATPTKFY
jgi:hypothetical protein